MKHRWALGNCSKIGPIGSLKKQGKIPAYEEKFLNHPGLRGWAMEEAAQAYVPRDCMIGP